MEDERHWKRRVGDDATHHCLLLRTDESGESLVKMREDGTASESPKDRYGPFPSMSGWVEWAIPVVGEPRAEDADAKSGLEPAP